MNASFKKVAMACLLCLPLLAKAQDENDIVNFLAAGPKDASTLMNTYLNPAIEGLSYGFNGGWFTTAKAHKTLGFDLGVAMNGVFIPSSKNYFNPNSLNLETVTGYTTASSNGLAPTIMGPNVSTTYFADVDGNGQADASFDGPKGLDFKETFKISGVLAPTVTLGIGVYKNTDLKIRWLPEIEYGSTKMKMLGFGVLHDIKQHMPGIKFLPFDLSMLVAYTNIKGSTGLEGTFAKPSNDTRAQQMSYSMNAWLIQALISKKLAVFTFYGGIGYNAVKTTSDVTGSYVIPGYQQPFKDPVSLNFKNNSFRVTGGIRLNLGPIYLNGEYTLQEYSTVTAGLGVTVR